MEINTKRQVDKSIAIIEQELAIIKKLNNRTQYKFYGKELATIQSNSNRILTEIKKHTIIEEKHLIELILKTNLKITETQIKKYLNCLVFNDKINCHKTGINRKIMEHYFSYNGD